jgi:hypothetical protein
MRRKNMIVTNAEIKGVVVEIPEGHKHLRTTLVLLDGREFTFQEATMANLVRAYITVKTHPVHTTVRLTGRHLSARKKDFAEWQLLESL